jgi:hypothetical protein
LPCQIRNSFEIQQKTSIDELTIEGIGKINSVLKVTLRLIEEQAINNLTLMFYL